MKDKQLECGKYAGKKRVLASAVGLAAVLVSYPAFGAAEIMNGPLEVIPLIMDFFGWPVYVLGALPSLAVWWGLSNINKDKKTSYRRITAKDIEDREHFYIKKLKNAMEENKIEMRREIASLEKAKSDGTAYTPKDKTEKAKNHNIDLNGEHYSFLKNYKPLHNDYVKIQRHAVLMKNSALGPLDKSRALELSELAGKIIVSLKSLNDIGGLTANLDSERYNEDNPSPVMRASNKMKEVLIQIEALIDKQVDRIGSSIDELIMPESNEIEYEFEKLKNDGNALLSIIKHKDTAVSKESEFVLKKVVEVRLDEMWGEYIRARSAYKPKEISSGLNLDKPQAHTPDEIITELFGLVRGMYADIEDSIRNSKENNAISDLLATKDYFVQRGKGQLPHNSEARTEG